MLFRSYGNMWFLRGAHVSQGLDSGVFSYSRTYGHASNGDSFRVDYTMLKERKYKLKEFKKSMMT